MMKSAPRPVNEPPTGTTKRPPPLVVSHSVSVSLQSCTLGNRARYQSLVITLRNCLARSVASFSEYDTHANFRLGLCPSAHATKAIDAQTDFRCRGGTLTLRRRIIPR